MKYYYAISSLPSLPAPGNPPPIMPSELLEELAPHPELQLALLAVFERMALQRELPLVESRWFDYFSALNALGKQLHIRFLCQLAEFELALAYELELVRFKRNPHLRPRVERMRERTVAYDGEAVSLAAKWANTDDPVNGYRLLLNGRLQWMRAQGQWFSFLGDEIVAYSAMLVVCIEAAVVAAQMPAAALRFRAPVSRWNWSAAQ
ncbi:MAG: hypothetical protein JXR76_25710 [Deltaproteobacteria bacterium]|nr:hypothetical protein [Deltaproteobacteria bacterium]